MKIVVLAGGGGTRLWPLSRVDQPKQFSHIVGDKTMYEQTVNRFLDDFDYNDIYVCLNNKLVSQAKELVPQIPDDNYIIEPEKRDTAPAMGYVAASLFEKFPDEPIAYVPADHFIADKAKFLNIIKKADSLIRETGKMVDIAIQPNFPSTVLGYTRIGKRLDATNGVEVFEFKGHAEKPEFEIAKKYIEQGDYLWHASYYMWTPRKILEAFREHSPEHHVSLDKIVNYLKLDQPENIKDEFSKMSKISFDYAVTEKIDPEKVMIIKGDFGWSDVGAFDVLYDSQKSKVDLNNNVSFGEWINENSSNCLIYNKGKKLVATIGMDDVVIVNTDDVVLICPKGKAQDVKKIVEQLKENEQHHYL